MQQLGTAQPCNYLMPPHTADTGWCCFFDGAWSHHHHLGFHRLSSHMLIVHRSARSAVSIVVTVFPVSLLFSRKLFLSQLFVPPALLSIPLQREQEGSEGAVCGRGVSVGTLNCVVSNHMEIVCLSFNSVLLLLLIFLFHCCF